MHGTRLEAKTKVIVSEKLQRLWNHKHFKWMMPKNQEFSEQQNWKECITSRLTKETSKVIFQEDETLTQRLFWDAKRDINKNIDKLDSEPK